MKGDKRTRRQGQPRAGQNGDHAGRQMKGDKVAAAAKSRPEWRSCNKTNEGRQGGRLKSSPEWRSCRETNEGRQGGRGSQEQPRMEIMQGDKWRKTRRPFGDQQRNLWEVRTPLASSYLGNKLGDKRKIMLPEQPPLAKEWEPLTGKPVWGIKSIYLTSSTRIVVPVRLHFAAGWPGGAVWGAWVQSYSAWGTFGKGKSLGAQRLQTVKHRQNCINYWVVFLGLVSIRPAHLRSPFFWIYGCDGMAPLGASTLFLQIPLTNEEQMHGHLSYWQKVANFSLRCKRNSRLHSGVVWAPKVIQLICCFSWHGATCHRAIMSCCRGLKKKCDSAMSEGERRNPWEDDKYLECSAVLMC